MKCGECFEDYDDGCEHRKVSSDPFSKDWCGLKNDYCDNVKPGSLNDKGFWRR